MTTLIDKKNNEKYEITWADKGWGISQTQAELNQKTIERLFNSKVNWEDLKHKNFKIYQCLGMLKNFKNFINEYLSHTDLSKMMKCVIILKSVLDFNKNDKTIWFNKIWHSQIASVVGCSYNTVRNTLYLIEQLKGEANKCLYGSYKWFDFINYLYKKRKEINSKERTILKLYEANISEGLASGRIKDQYSSNDDPPDEDDSIYFTKGF